MLTPEEQAELAAIDREIAQRNGLSQAEQQELAAIEQELQVRQQPVVSKQDEADLGFFNRLQYSLEPLESNRKAFLTQQFGAENVREDEQGNVYIREGNVFKPVNAEGLSIADIADVAGSAPEIIGSGAGALLGLGAGSIPGAIAGGAAGSVVRQGLSAALGTPQVAEPMERVTETALSGLMSGAGAGIGKGVQSVGKKIVPQLSKIFPKINIGQEGNKILRISKELNIPEPTPGQLSGGRTLDIEKSLGVRRFFGRKIRKQTDAQVEAIKNNLKNEIGDFIDTDSNRSVAGEKIKNIAGSTIETLRKQSSDLFNQFTDEAQDVAIPAKSFKRSLLGNFQKMGLFKADGTPLKHSSRTGMSKDQFDRLQRIFGTILEDIDASATDIAEGAIKQGQRGQYIDAKTLNTMRQFLDSEIKDGRIAGVDNLLLLKLKNNFLDMTEEMLGAKSPELRQNFKAARSLWAKQLKLREAFERGGQSSLKNMSDEQVLDKFMKTSNGVKQLKEFVGDDGIEEAGIAWINDAFTKKLGKEDQVAADSIANFLRDNREGLEMAIGKEKLKRLRDNVFYLARIGRPINPSKTAITSMMTLDPREIATGALERAVYGARATAENLQRNIPKYLERLPEQGARGMSAISDTEQREGAYKARRPSKR